MVESLSLVRHGASDAKVRITSSRFPLGAAATVTPAWTGDIESAGFDVLAVSLMMSLRPGQLRLDSGDPPAGWFPLPDAVAEAFGLPLICPAIVRLRCPLSSLGSRWTVVRS